MGCTNWFTTLSMLTGIPPTMDLRFTGSLLCEFFSFPVSIVNLLVKLAIIYIYASIRMFMNDRSLIFCVRDQSKHTNLGRIMEVHGPRLLGTSYKDPISSFNLFQKFTAQHPEVSKDCFKYHSYRLCFLVSLTFSDGIPGLLVNTSERTSCCIS